MWGSRCHGYSIGTLLFMSQGQERGWMGGSEGGMEGGWGVERQILCVNYSRSNNSMCVWWGLRVLRTHNGDAHKRKNAQLQVRSQMLSIATDEASPVLCTNTLKQLSSQKLSLQKKVKSKCIVAPWWPWSEVSFGINQYTCNRCR